MEIYTTNGSLRVRITPDEYSEIEDMGTSRHQYDTATGCKPKNDLPGYDTGCGTHTMGVTGEYVFGKLYGKSLTNRPDNGYDFILDNTWTIDVKYSSRPDGNLIFSANRPFVAMAAVLIVPTRTPLEYRVAGWITRSEFRRRSHPPRWNGKKGTEMVLEQSELYPTSGLLERFPLVTK